MSEKVERVGVKRESGYLYFIDKQGNISRVLMARGGKKGGRPSRVVKIGVEKEKGFLYFIDKDGDISRSVMSRGGKKKIKKSIKTEITVLKKKIVKKSKEKK
jgi:hypothetical protein